MLQTYHEKIPLSPDESGIIHIAGTRVTLECVAEMFEQGASPEEIVEQYDALQLDDVYAVITYVLRHRDELKAYLSHRASGEEQTRHTLEEKFPPSLRSKLLKAKRGRSSRES